MSRPAKALYLGIVVEKKNKRLIREAIFTRYKECVGGRKAFSRAVQTTANKQMRKHFPLSFRLQRHPSLHKTVIVAHINFTTFSLVAFPPISIWLVIFTSC